MSVYNSDDWIHEWNFTPGNVLFLVFHSKNTDWRQVLTGTPEFKASCGPLYLLCQGALNLPPFINGTFVACNQLNMGCYKYESVLSETWRFQINSTRLMSCYLYLPWTVFHLTLAGNERTDVSFELVFYCERIWIEFVHYMRAEIKTASYCTRK